MTEKIEGINPERIRWCCNDYSITLRELSEATKIKPENIDKVMSGACGLTFNQLRTIAEYFGRGVLFFFDRTLASSERVHSPQFRTIANQKPNISHKLRALIKRAEHHREIYIGLTEDLDEDRPRFTPPKEIPITNPKACAKMVRHWLGLGEQNDFDSYRSAVQSKGIIVFRSNAYAGKWQFEKEDIFGHNISGFSLYFDDSPVIVVRKERSSKRQAFTLMHELGHLLLHRTSFIDDEIDVFQNHKGKEGAANAFAENLLVPDGFLDQINDSQRPDDVRMYDEWLIPFKKAWGVSGHVILIRLQRAGRIKPDLVSDYFTFKHRTRKKINPVSHTKRWRHREPLHVFGEPYVRTVLSAFNAKHITLSRASIFLDNISIKDVHKLGDHCVQL